MPDFDLTLPQQLRRNALQRPAETAIRQKRHGVWQPITWADYFRRAGDVGLGLDALGVCAGCQIAVLSENRLEWVLAQFGAGMVGAVTVGVYATSPSREVAYVLAHSEAQVVFCEDQEQADKVLDAIAQLPRLRKLVVFERKGLEDLCNRLPGRVLGFAELEALGRENTRQKLVQETLAKQSMADIGLIIYTSGSTGKPKGAMLSYGNMAAMAPGVVERLQLDRHTSHLSYLPLCHVAEQMLTTFVPCYIGSRVDFGESIRTVQEDLREVAPTMFLGVPRIWEKLHASINLKINETGSLRRRLYHWALARCEPFAHKAAEQRSGRERLLYGLCYWLIFRALLNFIGLRRATIALTGAAPIAQAVVRYFRTLGVPLVEVYGMTETSGMVLAQRRDGIRWGSVGTPTRGVTYRVAPDGELQVRGAMVFAGYFRDDEATRGALQWGWLRTGDVVREQGGHLHIVDRLKDIMITAGGKNLTPSEIEGAVKASPYVKECIAVADGRKYVSALIQIEFDVVSQWAQARGVTFTHFRSLVETPQVRELIQQEVHKANGQMAEVAHVRRFHLLTKELDHDDGEVTATMKVRRASLHKAYAAEIDALYRPSAPA